MSYENLPIDDGLNTVWSVPPTLVGVCVAGLPRYAFASHGVKLYESGL